MRSNLSTRYKKLLEASNENKPEIIESIKKTGKLEDDVEKNLSSLIDEFKKNFKK